MSISICFVAEAKIDGKWKKIGTDDEDGLFFNCVSTPLRYLFTGEDDAIVKDNRRGLPSNISEDAKKLCNDDEGYCCSWVTLREINEFNWDESTWIFKDYADESLAKYFSNPPAKFPSTELPDGIPLSKDRSRKIEVSWVCSLKEIAKDFLDKINILNGMESNPDFVRFIYWIA